MGPVSLFLLKHFPEIPLVFNKASKTRNFVDFVRSMNFMGSVARRNQSVYAVNILPTSSSKLLRNPKLSLVHTDGEAAF